MSFQTDRQQLIQSELKMLGIEDEAVLHAMESVPREEFVPAELREFAYYNAPLPIELGQTISQPLVVAEMAAAMELRPSDRVLEIGTGSGYAAAVLGQMVRDVYTIERHEELAATATARLRQLGYDNVHVRSGDGTRGWPEAAPFDAILVSAGSPGVPRPLLDQLRIGGRLVIPVGEERETQQLMRITKRGEDSFETEDLGDVQFVPLIGEAGWEDGAAIQAVSAGKQTEQVRANVPALIREAAEPFSSIEDANYAPLLERIGKARLVLIGEATHGTSEFYRMRAEITRRLIEQKPFNFVGIEADWPDAYRIHDFVTHRPRKEPYAWEAFARFPTWMWRNQETLDFIHWLRDYNLQHRSADERVGFYGLDLYSLFTSIDRVLSYLDRVDPAAARVARTRYGCLMPWEGDPAIYGRAALSGRYRNCEEEVVQMLRDLSQRRLSEAANHEEALFEARFNARLVASAEQYYRVMYYGSNESWNLRDTHMFDTLCSLLHHHGDNSKAVVWEHNSHLGNAAATQMGMQGQINVGQLCRESFGEEVYAIGQGTDHGTVAAASMWEGAMEVKEVQPSLQDSYERWMHLTEMNAFFLPLTKSPHGPFKNAISARRLERAIGVVYRPESERLSHYFDATLPDQFDEWIWFDETHAVQPLSTKQLAEHEPAHPFATLDR